MSAAIKLNVYPSVKLVVQKGPHQGQRFTYSKGRITIGRSPENDIILVNDPLISRNHASINFENNEIEIVNLSDKNLLMVNNENVSRWKLTNNSIFTMGDSEFLFLIENQQSVVSVQPVSQNKAVKVLNQVHQAATQPVAKSIAQPNAFINKPKLTAVPNQPMATAKPKSTDFIFNQSQNTNQLQKNSFLNHPKAKIYMLILIILSIAGYFYLQPSAAESKKNKKPILTYADEVSLKLKSKENIDAIKKLEGEFKKKQTSSSLRVEEHFNKGMRAFQLTKYSLAIESFQQVLMLNSEHLLAKRYMRLSIIRFDEVVKAKLELGQSYFESNNFKLCISMFKQVIEMLKFKEVLQGQTKDINLQLAENMMKKCEFATEGIR